MVCDAGRPDGGGPGDLLACPSKLRPGASLFDFEVCGAVTHCPGTRLAGRKVDESLLAGNQDGGAQPFHSLTCTIGEETFRPSVQRATPHLRGRALLPCPRLFSTRKDARDLTDPIPPSILSLLEPLGVTRGSARPVDRLG